MNQQRSRRFRASKEGMEAAVEKQRVREEILAKGRENASLIWTFSVVPNALKFLVGTYVLEER